MKRPFLVRIVVALQALTGLGALVLAAIVLWKTRDPKLIAEGAETIHGLYLGAAIVGGAAIIFLVAGVLLWEQWRTGWWLTLFINGLIAAALWYDSLFENDPLISEDTAIGLWFVVSMVLLFFPAVRRFVFQKVVLPPAEAGSVS